MDEGILVVALVLLVSVVGGAAAVWMVGQAPVILPEAAFEALLAAGLVKAARRSEARGWTRGVLKSTVIPFALVRRLFPAQRAAACRLRLGCGWCRDMPRPAGSSGHFRSPCYGPDGRRLQAARLPPMSDPGENSNVPSLKGLHVLVIDDDDAACYVWRSYLSRAGAIVSTATDGPSALQGLQKNPVDIVVADLALPGMTGMEVVTHWSRARLLAPPVIAIAVTGHPELRADALRAGFTAFLEKPVDPLKLVQEIARHAKR